MKSNPLTDALKGAAGSGPRSPAQAKPSRRRSPAPTKLVGGHFPEPVHRQLRMLAAREGCTIQSLLAEALNTLFTGRRLPPIA